MNNYNNLLVATILLFALLMIGCNKTEMPKQNGQNMEKYLNDLNQKIENTKPNIPSNLLITSSTDDLLIIKADYNYYDTEGFAKDRSVAADEIQRDICAIAREFSNAKELKLYVKFNRRNGSGRIYMTDKIKPPYEVNLDEIRNKQRTSSEGFLRDAMMNGYVYFAR